jgi:hypothetical protein
MAEGSRALVPGRFRAEPAEVAPPGQSVRVQIVITAILAALSLALGLSGTDGLLHDWSGHPLPLRGADAVFGSIAYAGLWWRRRYPLIFTGYVLAVSTFSTLAGGLTLVAAYRRLPGQGHRSWALGNSERCPVGGPERSSGSPIEPRSPSSSVTPRSRDSSAHRPPAGC